MSTIFALITLLDKWMQFLINVSDYVANEYLRGMP